MFTTWLGLAIVVGAPGVKDGKEPETPSVVGEWTVQARVTGGRRHLDKQPFSSMELTAGGSLNLRSGRELVVRIKYKVDPAKKPAEFEWIPMEGEPPVAGIYTVERDTLVLCVDEAGTRPTKFESPAGSQVTLWTFKRVPKKD
jgi:uncharacterized protein (TIGR03067 family)